MRRILNLLGGAGLLGLSPLIVSLTTLISVPIVLGVLGSTVWLSIAVGQAIGELARVVVIWGWNSIGLTIVAAKDRPDRVRYYLDSLVPRLLLLIPAGIIAVIVAYVMPLVSHDGAALMALVGAVYGLNAGWAFIGGREPIAYLVWDSTPRALSTLVASAAIFIVPTAAAFGWINLLGSVAAVGIPAFIMVRRARELKVPLTIPKWSETWAALVRGAPAFGSGFILVLRMSFAVVVAPIISPVAGVTVALGDKFFRWTNTGMTPLMQALQVRIPLGSQPLEYRIRRGLLTAWVIGPLFGAAVALIMPSASSLISHGQIPLSFEISIPLGIAVAMVFIAGITGNSALVLLGRIRNVLQGAIIALIVLSSTFVPLTIAFGAAGSFFAFALSESTVTVYQQIVVWTALRRLRIQSAHPDLLLEGSK
jgi:hypothetical protein